MKKKRTTNAIEVKIERRHMKLSLGLVTLLLEEKYPTNTQVLE